MDEIFEKLMDSAGVPAGDREATLVKLRALKRQYPNETPARLFSRARKEGAPIPPARCTHGVPHGECVTCDSKIGPRIYFTSGGDRVHSRPTCDTLRSEGGPIEAVRTDISGRERCPQCAAAPSRRAATTRAATSRPVATRPVSRRLGTGPPPPRIFAGQSPVPLDAAAPPGVGDRIEWGGYIGEVTAITESGVRFTVEGISLTAPWGDTARVRKQP